jgi:hypothetical protein
MATYRRHRKAGRELYTKLHSKIEQGDQEDSDGGVQNIPIPNRISRVPASDHTHVPRVAGSRADAGNEAI